MPFEQLVIDLNSAIREGAKIWLEIRAEGGDDVREANWEVFRIDYYPGSEFCVAHLRGTSENVPYWRVPVNKGQVRILAKQIT